MVNGVASYAADVRTRRYPGPDHGYSIPAEELAAFKAALDAS
jgi:3-methyl-2-oxobutanoate hydroxymethyltransferase